MLKRKIEDKLTEWKKTPSHNPLIIKGCRQCGKTYSALQFARQNYSSVVYINFFENPLYSKIFEGSLDVDTLVMNITAILPESDFKPHDTCLILDEIQECPRARMALKFLKIDGRYDVIGTGSLLGIAGYKDDKISIPVGYETVIKMYPLDFEEYLWANGISDTILDALRVCVKEIRPMPELLHERRRELVKTYIIVGGMPAVVNEFISSHMLNRVLETQRNIINGYRDDMVKYAPSNEKNKIRECFNSIPAQLSKENKKFQYSLIKKRASAEYFEGSLQWLADAGIINKCHNLTITELPLDGNAETNVFKVYLADIGLLVSMLEDGTQADILNGSIYGYRGAVYENLVADFLSKDGKKLYYYRKDSGLEVDFVMRIDGECVIIESKAATGNTKSAKTILRHPEKYRVKHAIKLGDYNIGFANGILTLPTYLGFMMPYVTWADNAQNELTDKNI